MNAIYRSPTALGRLIVFGTVFFVSAGPADAQLRREESSAIIESERMFPGVRISIEETYQCPGAIEVWTSRSRRETELLLPDGRRFRLPARGRNRYADGGTRIRFLDGAMELSLAGAAPVRCVSQLASPSSAK